MDLYQEYLYVIGKIKDVYKLDIDVDHKDIHTFYKGKTPLFKLFYGIFSTDTDPCIVISFHIDMYHAEAIQWYAKVYSIHPFLKIHDSWVEDSNGETYLGEDALAIREVQAEQDILSKWLEDHTIEEMEEFAKAPVVGRVRVPYKPFDSHIERDKAIIEFKRVKKPDDDESVH